MTHIIIRFYDMDSVIATREWLTSQKGWSWLMDHVASIEWIEEAKCLLDEDNSNTSYPTWIEEAARFTSEGVNNDDQEVNND